MGTKKIYVLFGGGGFIGTNIYNRLMDENSYFMVIDNAPNAEIDFTIMEQEFINKDLDLSKVIANHIVLSKLNLSTVDSKKVDNIKNCIINVVSKFYYTIKEGSNKPNIKLYFIHLGSTVGVVNNLTSNFDKDVRMSQNIIRILNNIILDEKNINWVKRFQKIELIYASTSELFGEINKEKEEFIDQELCLNNIDLSCLYSPENHERSHYMYQKFIGEQLFRGFQVKILESENSNEFDIDTRILRFFNLVGPYQDPTKGVFSKFINHIFKSSLLERITPINKSGSIRRYIPINVLNGIFKDIDENSASKYNTWNESISLPQNYNEYNYMFSGEEYLTCSGIELYNFLYDAIIHLFKNIKLEPKEEVNFYMNNEEIKNRFESNSSIYNLNKFIKVYGSTILDTINILLQNNSIVVVGDNVEIVNKVLHNYYKNGLTFDTIEEPKIAESKYGYNIQGINNDYGLVTITLNSFGGYTNENIGNLINFENGGTGLVSGLKQDHITNYYYYEVVILGKMYKDQDKKEPLYHVDMGCDMGEKLIIPERESDAK